MAENHVHLHEMAKGPAIRRLDGCANESYFETRFKGSPSLKKVRVTRP